MAQGEISTHFSAKQRTFLEFVLAHYVTEGFRELDTDKLRPLLNLKYHDSMVDAVADLGRPEENRAGIHGLPEILVSESVLSDSTHSLSLT